MANDAGSVQGVVVQMIAYVSGGMTASFEASSVFPTDVMPFSPAVFNSL
jgi:hypothetical protein